MKRFGRKKEFTTTRIIAVGFFVAIVIGTFLLMLPLSSKTGKVTGIVDALFTSTTSVCVTGLVTVPTYAHWSLFGQVVIALLAQVGGLGVITFTTMFMLILRRRIGMKERLLIQDAYNLDTIQGLVVLVKKILKGTLVVETVGALLYMTVFIPDYGLAGIWYSVFNAVSAFCNAGMDVIGPDSLSRYVGNPVVNITTMGLIILGGLGFPVWWNVLDVMKQGKRKRRTGRESLHYLSLNAKLVLFMTAFLIVAGAILILILEYQNPATLGPLSFFDKIQAAFFQSVTTRTAGFCTISQSGLNKSTALVCCLLMFIGGSPSGTAGGIKTTTMAVLVLTVVSIIKGRRDTEMFARRVSDMAVRRALSIFAVSFGVMLGATVILAAVQPGNFIDCLYEIVSAIATVGLSRDFTPHLTTVSRLIIIVTMYIGRIGPISLALFFNSKRFVNVKTYPKERVSVG